MEEQKKTLQQFIKDNWGEKGEILLVSKHKDDYALDSEFISEDGNKFEVFISGNDITPTDDPMYPLRKIMKEYKDKQLCDKAYKDEQEFLEKRHVMIPNFIKKAYDVLIQKGDEGFIEWLDKESGFEIFNM